MISVIIPVYKVEKYLERCVNSVLNQTYKDLEIILVDDGSPDNCGKLCDNLQLQDSRIKVVHKQNGGQSSARNTGFKVSTGDYIAYVDSDDYIDKTMFEKLIACMKQGNVDIVQCGYSVIYENDAGKAVYKSDRLIPEEQIRDRNKIMRAFFKTGIIDQVVWNKLYKRDVLKNIQMVEGKWQEDTMATFDILLNANSIISISDPLYKYIKRTGSTTDNSFCEKNYDSLYAADYLISRSQAYIPGFVDSAKSLFCLNCVYLHIKMIKSCISLKEKKKEYKRIRRLFLEAYNGMEAKNSILSMRLNGCILVLTYRYFPAAATCLYSFYEKINRVKG